MVKLKRQKVRLKKTKIGLPQKSSKHLRLKAAAKFLMAVILLGVIGVGLVRLKYMLVDSDYFMLKGVDIKLYDEGGSLKKLSLAEIGDEKIAGTNIFFMDLNDLKEKIEAAHPEFKDVVVRRLLPNKLIAEASMRKAVAQIRSDRYYFVDKEGVLLPEVMNFPKPDFPIITGIGVSLARIQAFTFSDFEKQKLDKALSLISEINTIEELQGYKLRVVDITDPGNLSFSFEGVNVEIKIGNSDFRNRLSTLTTVLDQLGSDIDNFKYIDLRFEDPIVGPR